MPLAAAAAAVKMPNLETMEIWNGQDGLAMLFRYQQARGGSHAVIAVRGTWEFALRPAVSQAWAVSLKHRGRGFVIVEELLGAGTVIKSPAMQSTILTL